jgi:GNAT superfamily N-acetyltransferase
MGFPSGHHQLERATGPADIEDAAAIVGTAFSPLEASQWLIPEDERRRDVLTGVFRIIVGHALSYGQVDLLTPSTGDHDHPEQPKVGAAVWLHRDRPLPPSPDYAGRLRRAAGPDTGRFELLDELFEAHEPPEPHHHLALLAVLPEHQGRGIGTALLRRQLDSIRLPAYLEASSLDSSRLYAAHGFKPRGEPFALPNGALFYPMWREAPSQG